MINTSKKVSFFESEESFIKEFNINNVYNWRNDPFIIKSLDKSNGGKNCECESKYLY